MRAWPGEHIQSQAKRLKCVLKVELTPRLWGAMGGLGRCLWRLDRVDWRGKIGSSFEGEAGSGSQVEGVGMGGRRVVADVHKAKCMAQEAV